MKRTWALWLAFGACAVLLLAGMGRVTQLALRLDAARAAAEREALLEESVRLALWRMDSAVSGLLAREGGRPYFDYDAADAMANALLLYPGAQGKGGTAPAVPAPPEHVLFHFRFRPDGGADSPQALTASGAPVTGMLDEMTRTVDRDSLLGALPPAADGAATVVAQQQPQGPARQQAGRNVAEWQARAQSAQQITSGQRGMLLNPLVVADVTVGAMKPLWSGDLLLLARRVRMAGGEYVQGCRLDWPGVRAWLLAAAADLLPEARLEPAPGATEAEGERLLATLPVRLVPGEVAAPVAVFWSPIRVSLSVAWACVLVGGLAAGLLLHGALRLRDRMADFVSAVTHELRTPLTSLRIYAEMLSDGMVPEEQRQHYLTTLRAGAERLSRLVENVLSYARLEGGRRSELEACTVGELLDRCGPRLAELAARGGMELVDEVPEDVRSEHAQLDASLVEQVLGNLIDNACKYAQAAQDRRVHLEGTSAGGAVVIRVRDHGPGIAPAEAGRIFRAFRKSSQDAANSAPGIGLGLSLSRRLARSMGGDLRLENNAEPGACFALELPVA